MEYSFFLILLFSFLSLIIALIIFYLPLIFIDKHNDSEKLSTYECGFMPFADARGIFDIKFYLVSMLFLIFDIEVVFLFPWTLSFTTKNLEFLIVIIIFLSILIIGFYYEWNKGALNWNNFINTQNNK